MSTIKKSLRYFWYLIAFLLALEFSMRAEDTLRWGASFWGNSTFEKLTTVDELGERNRPYAKFEKWTINGQGFQGPELRNPKPDGVVRVGVAGASEIFGLYESPGGDVTSRLREMLEKSSPGKFEVVNLATPGMSTPRVIELYENRIKRFDFDVLIYSPSPAMYLGTVEPKFRNPGRVTAGDGPGNVVDPWDLNLRIPRKTWDMLRNRLPDRLQMKLKRYEIEKKRKNMRGGSDLWLDAAPQQRVDLFREHLEKMIETPMANGTRVILATHANRFRKNPGIEDDPYMVGWIRFYPKAGASALLDMEHKANQVIRELAVRYHLPMADVENKVGRNPDNFADFSHFSDSGAALVAEAMKDSILPLY